jgi:hypothetical protein
MSCQSSEWCFIDLCPCLYGNFQLSWFSKLCIRCICHQFSAWWVDLTVRGWANTTMKNDSNDAGDIALLTSAMPMETPSRGMSRIIPSKITLQAHICRSPPPWYILGTVRSLTSGQKTSLLIDNIVPCAHKVFKDTAFYKAIEIRQVHTSTGKTDICYCIVAYSTRYHILTLVLCGKQKHNLLDIAYIVIKLSTRRYWKKWLLKTEFRNSAMQFLLLQHTTPQQ